MKKSFETAYRRAVLPLTKFIVSRVGGDREAAEEVLSRTALAAWKSYKTFEHKSSFLTWVCRIALNKIADYWRDQVHYNSRVITPTFKALADYESNEISVEQRLMLDELRTGVHDCLNLLPHKTRRLLWLRYWKELSYKQIGKILGLSERAVEGRIYRAKKSFSKVYKEKIV